MVKKVGRPKSPRAKYKGKFVGIRVTTAEHRVLKKTAAAEGETLAAWVRRVLFERLEEEAG